MSIFAATDFTPAFLLCKVFKLIEFLNLGLIKDQQDCNDTNRKNHNILTSVTGWDDLPNGCDIK